MAKHILLLNGPNLNLLGTREPERYGCDTLAVIEARLRRQAEAAGAQLETFQTNSEAALVERVQAAASQGVDFVVVNPAAFTHTSVALRDAFAAVRIPFVELHLTNVHSREAFRQRSFLSEIALGTIAGLGVKGYELAVAFALEHTT